MCEAKRQFHQFLQSALMIPGRRESSCSKVILSQNSMRSHTHTCSHQETFFNVRARLPFVLTKRGLCSAKAMNLC